MSQPVLSKANMKVHSFKFLTNQKKGNYKVEQKTCFPNFNARGIFIIMIVTVIMNHLPTTKIYTLHSIDLQYKQW